MDGVECGQDRVFNERDPGEGLSGVALQKTLSGKPVFLLLSQGGESFGCSTDPRYVSRFLLLILFTSFQHMCIFSTYLTVGILIVYC